MWRLVALTAIVVGGVGAAVVVRDDGPPAPVDDGPVVLRDEFGLLEISSAFLYSDTRSLLGSYCGIDRFDWEIVVSDVESPGIRMEGEPSALLCGRHEEVEHTEPVGARLVVDDVSGEVVWDGRIWQGMPLLAVTDPGWMLLDAIFPPRLPDTPAPLDRFGGR